MYQKEYERLVSGVSTNIQSYLFRNKTKISHTDGQNGLLQVAKKQYQKFNEIEKQINENRTYMKLKEKSNVNVLK